MQENIEKEKQSTASFQFEEESVGWATSEFVAAPPPQRIRIFVYLIVAVFASFIPICILIKIPSSVYAVGRIIGPINDSEEFNSESGQKIFVELIMDENELEKIQIGNPVYIKVSAQEKIGKLAFEGELIGIEGPSEEVNESLIQSSRRKRKLTGAIKSIVPAENRQKLHPGMRISVKVVISQQTILESIERTIFSH